VALLIDTDRAEAIGVAERWRLDVAQQRTDHEDQVITFTVSIGAAQWQSPYDVDQLVRLADERLYVAKANGRNRVCA
jgi:diguanylate cyclase (GGDEF)-like protein